MKKVMVALDKSERSFYALNWALSHLLSVPSLGEEKEMMLYLINVQVPLQAYVYPAGPVDVAMTMDAARGTHEQTSKAIFARALQSCEGKRIKAKTIALHQDPKEMICQAVEELHVDLLVVGSRGLGLLKRAFLGSISDYCAQHAKCPVLIVRPPTQSVDEATQSVQSVDEAAK